MHSFTSLSRHHSSPKVIVQENWNPTLSFIVQIIQPLVIFQRISSYEIVPISFKHLDA
ncbi:hypothetical protein Scep_030269 [Stephania cephalantha]|uniref:Uncharacterized protein n=1 Tax=Stephania cephalantha TaxID=152367 RepID=A0AAP0E718_9MAGN